jgi:hypothetical protein
MLFDITNFEEKPSTESVVKDFLDYVAVLWP